MVRRVGLFTRTVTELSMFPKPAFCCCWFFILSFYPFVFSVCLVLSFFFSFSFCLSFFLMSLNLLYFFSQNRKKTQRERARERERGVGGRRGGGGAYVQWFSVKLKKKGGKSEEKLTLYDRTLSHSANWHQLQNAQG